MSEMSVEVQVGSVVVDAASVAHASRHKHGGLDPIATETPGAYAIPKADATGKLAAGFIPMGVISGGISTLDDLSDGSSYKRIAAAVATALNAGNLTFQTNIDDLHAIDGECWFTSTNAVSNAPSAGFYVGFQRYFAGNTNYREVVIWQISTGTQYSKVKHNGTWDASWKTIWDSGNDGNGGQPPAPKANATVDGVGYTRYGSVSAGNTMYFSGGTEHSSYWALLIWRYNTSGAVVSPYISGGYGTGGFNTVPAGEVWVYAATRMTA